MNAIVLFGAGTLFCMIAAVVVRYLVLAVGRVFGMHRALAEATTLRISAEKRAASAESQVRLLELAAERQHGALELEREKTKCALEYEHRAMRADYDKHKHHLSDAIAEAHEQRRVADEFKKRACELEARLLHQEMTRAVPFRVDPHPLHPTSAPLGPSEGPFDFRALFNKAPTCPYCHFVIVGKLPHFCQASGSAQDSES